MQYFLQIQRRVVVKEYDVLAPKVGTSYSDACDVKSCH